MDAEVIVVGAGPAGAALAAQLAAGGREVVLLDQAWFPRDKACGEYLSPGTVDALERLGALDTVLAAEHRRHPAMEIVGPHRQAALAYSGGRRALGIRRRVLDDILANFAVDRGARRLEGARVSGLVLDGGRVRGVRLREGRVLTGEFVVGADGSHSTVARALALDRRVHWPRRLGLIAHYELPAHVSGTAAMYVGDRFYCGINPVGGSEVNVGLVGRMRARRQGEGVGAYFERRVQELPGAAVQLAGARRAAPIRGIGPLARRVSAVSGAGFLLVGDAAGFFDPFTGEGVHRALVGAELAADGVETALKRADRRPSGYAEQRRRAFADKERLCLLVQLFLHSPRTFDYVLNRMALRSEPASVLAGALGDYLPARPATHPGQLAALLRP